MSAVSDGGSTIASEAVGQLTLGLRDSKQVLSRVMVRWMVRAPSLETDIALAALAQEELGHAQVLAGIYNRNFAGGGTGEEASERVTLNDAVMHPAVRPFDRVYETWPEAVALLCLWDSAVTTMFDSLTASSFTPLRHVAAKMCQEEANHWVFARAAAVDLIQRGSHVSESLRIACKQLIPEVDRWFRDIADIDALRRDAVIADSLPLATFAGRLGPILEDLKLTWPARHGATAE